MMRNKRRFKSNDKLGLILNNKKQRSQKCKRSKWDRMIFPAWRYLGYVILRDGHLLLEVGGDGLLLGVSRHRAALWNTAHIPFSSHEQRYQISCVPPQPSQWVQQRIWHIINIMSRSKLEETTAVNAEMTHFYTHTHTRSPSEALLIYHQLNQFFSYPIIHVDIQQITTSLWLTAFKCTTAETFNSLVNFSSCLVSYHQTSYITEEPALKTTSAFTLF